MNAFNTPRRVYAASRSRAVRARRRSMTWPRIPGWGYIHLSMRRMYPSHMSPVIDSSRPGDIHHRSTSIFRIARSIFHIDRSRTSSMRNIDVDRARDRRIRVPARCRAPTRVLDASTPRTNPRRRRRRVRTAITERTKRFLTYISTRARAPREARARTIRARVTVGFGFARRV